MKILQQLGICIVSFSTILSLQPLIVGSSPIQLKVTPQILLNSSKTPIILVITIDPNPDNRVGSVEIVGENYYSGSEFPITSAKTYRFERRVTEAGSYDVIAKLKRSSGEIFSTQQNLVVAEGEVQTYPESKP